MKREKETLRCICLSIFKVFIVHLTKIRLNSLWFSSSPGLGACLESVKHYQLEFFLGACLESVMHYQLVFFLEACLESAKHYQLEYFSGTGIGHFCWVAAFVCPMWTIRASNMWIFVLIIYRYKQLFQKWAKYLFLLEEKKCWKFYEIWVERKKTNFF